MGAGARAGQGRVRAGAEQGQHRQGFDMQSRNGRGIGIWSMDRGKAGQCSARQTREMTTISGNPYMKYRIFFITYDMPSSFHEFRPLLLGVGGICP